MKTRQTQTPPLAACSAPTKGAPDRLASLRPHPEPPMILAVAGAAAPLGPLLAALSLQGYTVRQTASASGARRALALKSFDLVLVAGEDAWQDRLRLARAVRRRLPELPVLLVGRRETDFPPEAFSLEVTDYLLLSEPVPALVQRVARSLNRPYRRCRLEAERRAHAYNARAFGRMQELALACHALLQAPTFQDAGPMRPPIDTRGVLKTGEVARILTAFLQMLFWTGAPQEGQGPPHIIDLAGSSPGPPSL